MPGFNHKGGYSRSINLIGKRFTRLTVLEKAEPFRDKNGKILCAGWKCLCDCGNEIVVRTHSLTCGNTKSCGCWNKEKPSNHITHHMSNAKIYFKYKSMIRRCNDEKYANYKHYGGRGIKVCEEWSGKDGFINFYNWAMSNGYDDSLTIERMDVNDGYCPKNCCWIPFSEQSLNKTNSYIVNGIGVARLAREINTVPPSVARERCKRGWDLSDAVSIPLEVG